MQRDSVAKQIFFFLLKSILCHRIQLGTNWHMKYSMTYSLVERAINGNLWFFPSSLNGLTSTIEFGDVVFQSNQNNQKISIISISEFNWLPPEIRKNHSHDCRQNIYRMFWFDKIGHCVLLLGHAFILERSIAVIYSWYFWSFNFMEFFLSYKTGSLVIFNLSWYSISFFFYIHTIRMPHNSTKYE